MVWLMYGMTVLYALLMIVASFTQIKNRGYHWNYGLFIMLSIVSILILFINEWIMIPLLILIFIGFHITAVTEGLRMHQRVSITHHIVRLALHTAIILIALMTVK